MDVSKQMKVPDEVYEQANKIADARDTTMKEALRLMAREGGYDV